MLEISVTVQNGTEVRARLAELARAAEVIGASRVKIGSDLDYAKYVVEGTRPHDIYPRDKQALFWEGAMHPVGHVHHPGTKPNPFLELALASTRGIVEIYVADRLEMVASGHGGNYSQIMPGAGRIVLEAARQEAPIGTTGQLRASLYMVDG
ncbi:MAG: hypothetical protein NVSMB2_25470 [Chloroflexota bacterium]